MNKGSEYTLTEAGLVLGGLPVVLVLFTFGLGVPIGLLNAWIRELVWNWFAPYIGLPQVSLWVMFALGLIWALFVPTFPSLKKDHYEGGWANRIFNSILGNVLTLLVASVVHHWILK